MVSKGTKVLACRVSVVTHELFTKIAKGKGLTPGEYLKEIVEKGIQGVNTTKKPVYPIGRPTITHEVGVEGRPSSTVSSSKEVTYVEVDPEKLVKFQEKYGR